MICAAVCRVTFVECATKDCYYHYVFYFLDLWRQVLMNWMDTFATEICAKIYFLINVVKLLRYVLLIQYFFSPWILSDKTIDNEHGPARNRKINPPPLLCFLSKVAGVGCSMSKTQDYPEILTLTLQAIIILIALPLTRSQLDWIDLYLAINGLI